MSDYCELNGIRTWFDERGNGEPLVMFHPGGVGVDSRAFGPNIDALASQFQVFLPDRRGHGHTADAPGEYSYELFADDMILFIEEIIGGPTKVIGMSDGAVVALLVARKRPDLVERLICAGGVFHNDGWMPGVIDPTDEPPDFLVDSFESISPDGRDHAAVIHGKLDRMHARGPKLTTGDLSEIQCRTLVMAGDDDEMSLEHTMEFYRSLPKGELAVIPGTSHGLLVEKPELCNRVMIDFLSLDPVTTFAPIRRAAS